MYVQRGILTLALSGFVSANYNFNDCSLNSNNRPVCGNNAELYKGRCPEPFVPNDSKWCNWEERGYPVCCAVNEGDCCEPLDFHGGTVLTILIILIFLCCCCSATFRGRGIRGSRRARRSGSRGNRATLRMPNRDGNGNDSFVARVEDITRDSRGNIRVNMPPSDAAVDENGRLRVGQDGQVEGDNFEYFVFPDLPQDNDNKHPMKGSSDVCDVDDDGETGNECAICFEKKRNTVLPCGHSILCYACCEKILCTTQQCPSCRQTFRNFLLADNQPVFRDLSLLKDQMQKKESDTATVSDGAWEQDDAIIVDDEGSEGRKEDEKEEERTHSSQTMTENNNNNNNNNGASTSHIASRIQMNNESNQSDIPSESEPSSDERIDNESHSHQINAEDDGYRGGEDTETDVPVPSRS